MTTVSFVNSGAEANEKAYALCMANAKEGQTKLLAFEGSFHGRTMLALYASSNPSKRVPFQIAGYEVDYAPAPARGHVTDGEPPEPEGWTAAWADPVAARAAYSNSEDPLLAAEVEAEPP